MKLYTSNKEKIARIVGAVSCEMCGAEPTHFCALNFPQCDGLHYTVVHNDRKHAWKLQQKAEKMKSVSGPIPEFVGLTVLRKRDVSEIVDKTGCETCQSPSGSYCSIEIPQAGLDDFAKEQLRLTVVHDSRFRDYNAIYRSNDSVNVAEPSVQAVNEPYRAGMRAGDEQGAIGSPVAPKCTHCDAVYFNEFNDEIQCHACGDVKRNPVRDRISMCPPINLPPFTFSAYERWTHEVAIYAEQGNFAGLNYTALGLTGEAGEFADKLKKIVRTGMVSYDKRTTTQISSTDKDNLVDELGDLQWYVARAAIELNVSLEEVAKRNYDKLNDRKLRGVLHGEGDKR